jgi:EAL domain-containing protein (putative c-di-GMP-specific phosphodiesterase class I)
MLASGGQELSLVFQPIRSCGDGTTITGYEALLRWLHPDYGPVSPADFIPVAERNGLTAELDRWVLREACRLAMRFPAPRRSVAVNVTPSFLVAPSFLDTVESALAESGLPHHDLCIELTERVFLGNRLPAGAVTGALLARGVQVALDDFGAGHASFGYLAEISATKVKVDGALIAALQPGRTQPERAAAILRGIVTMARGLGLGVVAECVETAGQLRMVRELGCDEAQGWHLGRPAPLAKWLEPGLDPGLEPAAAPTESA